MHRPDSLGWVPLLALTRSPTGHLMSPVASGTPLGTVVRGENKTDTPHPAMEVQTARSSGGAGHTSRLAG